tara:strand:- start:937 stop:1074 length:138 start_codon:yes stop_codon:yes gene_type:complete
MGGTIAIQIFQKWKIKEFIAMALILSTIIKLSDSREGFDYEYIKN